MHLMCLPSSSSFQVERFGRPTWRRLVEAVEDHVGGNNRALAQTIAAEHPGVCVCVATYKLSDSLLLWYPSNMEHPSMSCTCDNNYILTVDVCSQPFGMKVKSLGHFFPSLQPSHQVPKKIRTHQHPPADRCQLPEVWFLQCC